jgi:FkbM family methyltransferase
MHHPVFANFEIFTSNEVSPEFHYGFLGEVRRKSFEEGLAKVLGRPMPSYAPGQLRKGDYPAVDEEYFEWIDVLETAIAATGSFTMIELGAGYGRWMVRSALAVKQFQGDIPIKLVGVEAEPTHFQWLKDHLRDNGIDPGEHELIEAAVAEQDGEIYFYVGKPDEWYGQAIAEHATAASESIQKVRAVSLSSILSSHNSVDLLDLDVQGAEATVLNAAITAVNERVKRVHIGTHGHDLEVELRTLFRRNGWYKLNDYTCQSTELTPWGETVFGDGVQTWINPRFFSVPPTATALSHLQEVLATAESREARLRTSLAESHQKGAQLETSLKQSQEEIGQLQAEIARSKTVTAPTENSESSKAKETWWSRLKNAAGIKST